MNNVNHTHRVIKNSNNIIKNTGNESIADFENKGEFTCERKFFAINVDLNIQNVRNFLNDLINDDSGRNKRMDSNFELDSNIGILFKRQVAINCVNSSSLSKSESSDFNYDNQLINNALLKGIFCTVLDNKCVEEYGNQNSSTSNNMINVNSTNLNTEKNMEWIEQEIQMQVNNTN